MSTDPVYIREADREGRFVGVDDAPDGMVMVYEDFEHDRFAVPAAALFSGAARRLHAEDPSAQMWLSIQGLLNVTEIREVHAYINAITHYEAVPNGCEGRLEQALGRLEEDGLPVGRQTFYNKLAGYRQRGPVGLLRANHSAIAAYERTLRLRPIVKSAITIAKSLQRQPKISIQQFIARVRPLIQAELHADNTTQENMQPGNSEIDDLLRSVYYAARLDEELDTRAGQLGLHTSPHRFTTATSPFATVQIDRTQLDIRLTDRKGRAMAKCDGLFAIDVCTRRILGFLIVPKNATGKHVQALILQLTRGLIAPTLVDNGLPALPHTVEVEGDVRELIRIAEIVTDRGSPESSQDTQGFFADLGINIRTTPPGRGDAKGLIEGFFQILRQITRVLPGATGGNAAETGHDSTVEKALELEQFTLLLQTYIDSVYHRQPRVDPLIPDFPLMSPNEALIWEVTRGTGIPTADVDDISRLRSVLHCRDADLDVRGVMHHGMRYLDQDGHLTALLNNVELRVESHSGGQSVPIHFHPQYEDVIFAEVPGQVDLIPCFPHLPPRGPFGDVRAAFHLGALFNLDGPTPLIWSVKGSEHLIGHPFDTVADAVWALIGELPELRHRWSDAKANKRAYERSQRTTQLTESPTLDDTEESLLATEQALQQLGLFDDNHEQETS